MTDPKNGYNFDGSSNPETQKSAGDPPWPWAAAPQTELPHLAGHRGVSEADASHRDPGAALLRSHGRLHTVDLEAPQEKCRGGGEFSRGKRWPIHGNLRKHHRNIIGK